MERNFRILKERRLYGIDLSRIGSLEEFNRMLADYIRKHNTTRHSVTGMSLLERYLPSKERIRKPESGEWLEEYFHNRLIRKVNRDVTIHLSGMVYDALMQFIGQKVEVRFLSGDSKSAYILYGGRHYLLRVTDREANGRTKRKPSMEIHYGQEGETHLSVFLPEQGCLCIWRQPAACRFQVQINCTK